MAERFKMIGGVLNIIFQNDKVLMMRRRNKFDAGTDSLPGGCLEEDETVALLPCMN